jgi:AraC-like DNA-binding protein
MTVLFRDVDEPRVSRHDYWRHVVTETLGPLDLRAPAGINVPKQFVVGDVGAVQVAEMKVAWVTPSTFCEAVRTPRIVRGSDSELSRIDLVMRGEMVVEQDGREARLGPGDFSFVDLSRPARWATAAELCVAVTFPRALLALRPDEAAQLTAVRIPGDQGTGALLSTFAQELVGHLDDYGAADGTRLGAMVVDLLTAALASRLGRGGELPPDTHQHALLLRIHAFIEQHLGDPSLSPDMIAAAQYISPRYLYRLFETQGQTVAGWIRHRRLERCRRDLLDPALRDRPASAIAARWGLPNAAYFNRLFRVTYGVPPGEYRRIGNESSPQLSRFPVFPGP